MSNIITINVPKRRNEYNEYVVKVRENGVRIPDSDYFTEDREDALGTANQMALHYKRQGHRVVKVTA